MSTIYESFTLPSKGFAYDKEINPVVTLRSMTTMEEMKRLSPTDMPYKVMSDIIEDCMQEKPPIHVYDMCLGDYQFLLHKIRIVTYGSSYKMTARCPHCGKIITTTGNLDDMEINEWDEEIVDKKLISLPMSNHEIELKFQTPRDLDWISYKNKEMRERTKQNIDYSVLFTLCSLIKKVDGRVMNSKQLEEFVKQLPNRDANMIINRSNELTKRMGINNSIKITCPDCGDDVMVPFRITSEFFGPTDDGRW